MKETGPSAQLLPGLSETRAAQWAGGETQRDESMGEALSGSPCRLKEGGYCPLGLIMRCQERVFWVCRRHSTAHLEEEPKARKEREESGLGQNKHRKILGEKKG